MNPIPPAWKDQHAIGWLDVDVVGRLRPESLFAWLLEAASSHAEGTPYGYHELAAQRVKWVMVKMQLHILRQPRWGDRVIVETWGKRIERLYAMRDFAMTTAAGEKLVSATSAWLIVDQQTLRPQRWDARAQIFPWQTTRDELITRVEKVPELQAGEELARFRAHFSDIDVNRHVNATRYLRWIVDSHAGEHLEACELASVDLSFLNEALPGDEVGVLAEERGGSELCSVHRLSDGRELCRAQLAWRASV